jgi:phosphopantothenoylcysteine decarboxylase/phosphopantothenate--cysteine ligase
VDALFHTAAVSDFRFGTVWARSGPGDLVEVKAGKISSRLEGFLVELVPTPKIILELRDWFPSACLVGWKYEVDGDRLAAMARAGEQIQASRTDACVVNGPAYGSGFGVVSATGHCLDAGSREELFRALEALAAPKPAVNP